MDAKALTELHRTLQAQGFTGELKPLQALLDKAEDDTVMRRVLGWWERFNAHAALVSTYRHASKRNLRIATFESADKVTLVLSSSKNFNGVYLGRLVVTKQEILWCFYKRNEPVGERAVSTSSRPLAWECNGCGLQEYSESVSFEDVHKLACSHCGDDEWHLTAKIDT